MMIRNGSISEHKCIVLKNIVFFSNMIDLLWKSIQILHKLFIFLWKVLVSWNKTAIYIDLAKTKGEAFSLLQTIHLSEILEGARLLEISCIRMAEYESTAYSEAKHQTWRTEVWHELSFQKSTLTVGLVFAILEFCSDLNWQFVPMQLVHTNKGEAYSLLQAIHLQPLQRNPFRALSLGSVEN